MIRLLQEYIRINTAQPNPEYDKAIVLFKNQATHDGFITQEFILPSGNPVLIITYEGHNKTIPALALNHHMDVVPADNEQEWTTPPFAAEIRNNMLIGRGTQDMKGVGVMHYAALQKLKKNNIKPERTIHLIMVPDEETGGHHGTREFLQHPLFPSLNIGYLLDEGMPSGDNTQLLIKIAERTPIQIKVTSKGIAGHASFLHHPNSAHQLINFLTEIVQFQSNQQRAVNKTGDDAGSVLSMNITSLITNNEALNIIPSLAYATIDIRLPAHVSFNEGIAIIDSLCAQHPTITYEIMATSAQRCAPSNVHSAFYTACADAIKINGLTPKNFIFQATTDARFYGQKNIETIGLTPFCTAPNLHGTNESIHLHDMKQGKTVILSILNNFCKSK